MVNQTLYHEAQARQIIRKGFTIVSKLSTNIIKANSILQYNQENIKIVRNIIPDDLHRLIMLLDDTEKLESKAFVMFTEFTESLFEIIGPDAALYIDRKAQLEIEIEQCQFKQHQLALDLQNQQDKLILLDKNIKKLTNQIDNLNAQLIFNKQNIRELCRTKSLLNRNLQRNLQKCFTNNNNNRLQIRMQINEMILTNKKCDRNNILDSLANCLLEIEHDKSDYNRTLAQLDTMVKSIDNNICINTEQIQLAQNELAKIRHRSNYIETHIGLNGKLLIDFLVALRLFCRTIHNTTPVYATIRSILSEIRSEIECPVEMLTSLLLSDVLIGQKMLIDHAPYLLNYSNNVRKSITVYHKKRCWQIEQCQ